jgi:hypothetical protein
MRIDVMSAMRGVAPFDELWERRTSLTTAHVHIELMSLPDLVLAKKTQRDKDWPMIRRLIESDYAVHKASPSPRQLQFWLKECRTPEILIALAERHTIETNALSPARDVLRLAFEKDKAGVERLLAAEETIERKQDEEYWKSLRLELEDMRQMSYPLEEEV